MSESVAYNGIVWLAATGQPGASVTEQTAQALAEVDRLLAEAGTDKTRILSAQIWLADIGTFAEMNAAWDAWVPQGHTPPPRHRRGEAGRAGIQGRGDRHRRAALIRRPACSPGTAPGPA